MKKKKAKKPKKRKKAAKTSRRRRAARIRPIVGPFQIELPLQMPLFPFSAAVPPVASTSSVEDVGTAASVTSSDDD